MSETFIPLPMDIVAVVRSMRSFGYSFEDAVADIVDNSISAGADTVIVVYRTSNPKRLSVAFKDNGCGMTEDEIQKALCFGKHMEHQGTKVPLGKFGMGLKTASLSQCRCVTVASKKEGKISAVCLDLNVVEQRGEIVGRKLSPEEVGAVAVFSYLNEVNHGTVVLWNNFDHFVAKGKRVTAGDILSKKIAAAKSHVALVFHEFYRSVEIYFNAIRVSYRDPFLMNSFPRRNKGAAVDLGRGVTAVPYALPYANSLREDEKRMLGLDEGADYFRDQGIYIYRNKRLIHYGGWFRLKPRNENYRYARVRIDLTDADDEAWMLDVRKATIQLPEDVKNSLRTAIEDALTKSSRKCIEEGVRKISTSVSNFWNFKRDTATGESQVRIDLREAICQNVINNASDGGEAFQAFVHFVEKEFPWEAIRHLEEGGNS